MDIDIPECIEIASQIVKLGDRRAVLQGEVSQIRERLTELRAALASIDTPAVRRALGKGGRIRDILEGDPKRSFGPTDLAEILGIESKSERDSLRLLLRRMSRDGRAQRVGHGRYQALTKDDEEKEKPTEDEKPE